MNVILMRDNAGSARVIALSQAQIIALAATAMLLVMALGVVVYSLTLKFAVNVQNPYVQQVLSMLYQEKLKQNETEVQANLSALAVKLGELQARLMRLDAFGARLAKAAGVKADDFQFTDKPGRGGPLIDVSQAPRTIEQFQNQLAALSQALDDRSDKLGILDSMLLDNRTARQTVPTTLPVSEGYYSSNFGYRADPITGGSAFHAGVDFTAPTGTPVAAAAGGVVSLAQWHHDYGQMIEIEHDSGYTTRYAHLSKMSAKPGDVVLKGQRIGEVGNTGRSTGPHLHFEVRENGVPLNPTRFLNFAEGASTTRQALAPTLSASR